MSLAGLSSTPIVSLMQIGPARCRVFEIGDIAEKLLGDAMDARQRRIGEDGIGFGARFGELLSIGEDIGDHVARRGLMRRVRGADRLVEIERTCLDPYRRRAMPPDRRGRPPAAP